MKLAPLFFALSVVLPVTATASLADNTAFGDPARLSTSPTGQMTVNGPGRTSDTSGIEYSTGPVVEGAGATSAYTNTKRGAIKHHRTQKTVYDNDLSVYMPPVR